MGKRGILLVKWCWLLAVLVGVIAFALDRHEVIARDLGRLSPAVLFGTTLLMVIAKIALVANLLTASHRFQIALSWSDAFAMYNLSQLAKYVPGSIWQFVSRAGMLRQRQVDPVRIRNSIVAETLWVLGAAAALSLAVLPSVLTALRRSITAYLGDGLLPPLFWWGPILAAALVLLVVIGHLRSWMATRLLPWIYQLRPPRGIVALQLVCWLSLAASFWLTLLPFIGDRSLPPFFVVGAYCLSWVVGFLVPFAPAGLGVRELVLTLAFAPYLDSQTVVLLAGINRLLYFLVEVLLAFVAFLLLRLRKTASHLSG